MKCPVPIFLPPFFCLSGHDRVAFEGRQDAKSIQSPSTRSEKCDQFRVNPSKSDQNEFIWKKAKRMKNDNKTVGRTR